MSLGIRRSSDGAGRLRIYLGAAPGVGKTFAMLDEGRRRAARGTDVVVGFVETPRPAAHRGACSAASRWCRAGRSTTGARRSPRWTSTRCWPARPQVALVDELAHTNVPGSRHEKRWQDVEELLDGRASTCITTVNIQHLESLNDVVEAITGIAQRETVPDAVVRAADQVELVDMTPEALRRRMAHGNIYPPDKVDAALANYFRLGNLTALRELALLWLADQVDEGLQRYRDEHGIADTWETRERVVVALTGGPEGETLIRRAARIAARAAGGDLLAVHIARSDGLAGASPVAARRAARAGGVARRHATTRSSATTSRRRCWTSPAADNATQLVIGASRRNPAGRAHRPGHRRDHHPAVRQRSTCTWSRHAYAGHGPACCRG